VPLVAKDRQRGFQRRLYGCIVLFSGVANVRRAAGKYGLVHLPQLGRGGD
jgi:hypothetical protein